MQKMRAQLKIRNEEQEEQELYAADIENMLRGCTIQTTSGYWEDPKPVKHNTVTPCSCTELISTLESGKKPHLFKRREMSVNYDLEFEFTEEEIAAGMTENCSPS